jgi:elongation factor Ts
VRFEAPEGAIIGSYLHLQNGRGVNAVLVEVSGANEALAHEIALHVAFARPEFLRREDVPSEQVEDFRKTAIAIAQNEGKPAAALDKIIEGRLQGWFKERVLLEQPFVRDEQQTIAQLLGGAEVLRFAQAVVGS